VLRVCLVFGVAVLLHLFYGGMLLCFYVLVCLVTCDLGRKKGLLCTIVHKTQTEDRHGHWDQHRDQIHLDSMDTDPGIGIVCVASCVAGYLPPFCTVLTML